MNARPTALDFSRPLVVGSMIHVQTRAALEPAEVASACDILEIRLDGMATDGAAPSPTIWRSLAGIPLLFTARRPEEGGLGGLSTTTRATLLENALPYASLLDIEAASIPEMGRIVEAAAACGVPWIASFHDFEKVPGESVVLRALAEAKAAGAAVFKWAAMIQSAADLARLAEFQSADHGIPVATMGMGPLAVVSRLLCAQCGSVLNYGYLGDAPTAPGQWHAAMLKNAISALPAFTPR